MRRPILTIVLLLLLLNAASFYWFTQRPAGTAINAPVAPAADPEDRTRLKLLSEVAPEVLIAVDEAPRSATKEASKPSDVHTTVAAAEPAPEVVPTPTPPTRTAYCFITPPFATDSGDDAVLRTLAHIPDVEVNMAPEPVTESTTYWVRLKGFRTPREAASLLKELRDKGLKDVATTPVKERGSVVSLGLYRFAQSAQDRLHELNGMGYDPEIIELKKTRTGLRYRINILAASERQARAYLREYDGTFPDHPPQLQDCPE
ncbi:MAG: hypothetical protein GC138_10210 [Gammaproteobacteria bacterium]|nr:hypothetical protein [Gammaproteobacteria bacterium]